MNSLSSTPFIRILPSFCIGIACSFFNVLNYTTAFVLLCIGISGLILFFSKRKPDFTDRCYTGLSLQFIYFVFGFTLTEIKDERLSEIHFSVFPESKYFIATVDNSPKGHDGNFRAIVSIISVIQNHTCVLAKGKSILYFKNDANANHLNPGDRIVFKGLLSPIAAPLNPGQFDFRYWSSLHRVYHQVHLGENDWKKLPSPSGFFLKALSVDLRNKFLATYKNAGLEGQEYAVLSALVLGYEDDIDRETMKAFSASGTLHVLSVSGMHVGIIFTALSAMLTFLERKRYTRIIRLFILLLALWFYALLTGLSPSVIRSAMMFSFILVGRSLNRSSNIYNSLSLSALCIFVLFDPLMLLEVGLQLSFLAVAGIAFLYPKIYKLIFFENKLFDKIWALIAVSIAAQVATFALSIYYFHQFPNYFIPANLVIIPLSTVGIFAGILLLFINPLPYLCIKTGWLVKQVIYLLNASAIFIEDIPGSVWHGISINIFDLVIIYLILFAIVFFLEKKSIKYLYTFQISCCVLFASFLCHNYFQLQQKNLLIFSNSSSFCCQLNNGLNSYLLYHSVDSTLAFKYSDDYCISKGLSINNRTAISLDNVKNYLSGNNIFIYENYILINKYLIQDISKNENENHILKNIKANIVYVNKYTLKNVIKNKIQTDEIVISGKGGADSIEAKLIYAGIKIHHLSLGAKIIEL